jgi:hypothetical protein
MVVVVVRYVYVYNDAMPQEIDSWELPSKTNSAAVITSLPTASTLDSLM